MFCQKKKERNLIICIMGAKMQRRMNAQLSSVCAHAHKREQYDYILYIYIRESTGIKRKGQNCIVVRGARIKGKSDPGREDSFCALFARLRFGKMLEESG